MFAVFVVCALLFEFVFVCVFDDLCFDVLFSVCFVVCSMLCSCLSAHFCVCLGVGGCSVCVFPLFVCVLLFPPP